MHPSIILFSNTCLILNFQVKQMGAKDLRLKMMNEILNGIKVIQQCFVFTMCAKTLKYFRGKKLLKILSS